MGSEQVDRSADVLRIVDEAMRIRMVWEEVCATHWARPFDEVEDALTEAARKWKVPIDSTFTTRAALEIYAGSWE